MVSVEEQATISDIIGVAGAGFRLSLILNAVSCEVENEGLEVHNISKTVTLFALTLKNVGISLQSSDSVHTGEALEGVRRISDDAMEVFDQFNEMLDRVRAKPLEGTPQHSIQQRFQWCFKKHRVAYLLGQLESLKMDASLFQQVLSLGKLMASTNKHDPPEEVALKQELIRQERAEAQNVLIVRYWQKAKMEGLWEASLVEETDIKIAALEHSEQQHDDKLALVPSNGDHPSASNQLAIEAPPPEYASSSSTALVKLDSFSLGEVDSKLHAIKKSSKDMVQVSSDALEPLLERWTRWYEVREARHKRATKNRYVPTVDVAEDDEGMQPSYQNNNGQTPTQQPRGYYLEGSTHDWRQPHSASARQDYSRRKQAYRGYQPSISVDNSDADTNSSRGSRGKKAPRRHIIDSSSESEVSDHELAPQHRPNRPRKGSNQPSPVMDRSVPVQPPQHNNSYSSPRTTSGSPMPNRPHPHHAYTVPGGSGSHPYPPINIANAHNPYAASPTSTGPYPLVHYPSQPTPHHQNTYPPPSAAHARYTPAAATPSSGASNGSSNRIPIPQPYGANTNRPISRDGPIPPGRPTSSYGGHPPPPLTTRQSSGPLPPGAKHPSGGPLPPRPTHDRDAKPIVRWSTDHATGRERAWVWDERAGREVRANLPVGGTGEGRAGKHGKLAEGATKGLLGAGAIAGFLEALEGLSI